MMRLLAAAAAVALFALLRLTTAAPGVTWAGLVGLGVTAVAIAALWRWPATAAACLFLAGYAAALWIERAPVSVVPALGFGLALLVLLQAVDLACRARGATVGARVLRVTLGRWVGLGAGALLVAMLAMALATSLATALPAVASPLLAAVGGLGSVLVLAVLIRRAR
jgi:hypothetical protein